jgi:hypothetical protein
MIAPDTVPAGARRAAPPDFQPGTGITAGTSRANWATISTSPASRPSRPRRTCRRCHFPLAPPSATTTGNLLRAVGIGQPRLCQKPASPPSAATSSPSRPVPPATAAVRFVAYRQPAKVSRGHLQMVLSARASWFRDHPDDLRELRHRAECPPGSPKYVPKPSAIRAENQVRASCGAVCKTVGSAYDGSNPSPATIKSQVRPGPVGRVLFVERAVWVTVG